MKVIAYFYERKVRPTIEDQQREARKWAKNCRRLIDEEFTEEDKSTWATLRQAAERAKRKKALLLIPRFGRLAHNSHFLRVLQETGVDFLCLDAEAVESKNLDRLIVAAEEGNRERSEAICAAMDELRAKGVPLGGARPGHWENRDRDMAKAQAASVAARTARAHAHYVAIWPTIQALFEKSKIESAKRRKKLVAARKRLHKEFDGPAYWDALAEERKKIGTLETWKLVCEWLSERNIMTTAGKPFTPTALLRVKRACE